MKLGTLEETITKLKSITKKKLPVTIHYAIAVNLEQLNKKYVEYCNLREKALSETCIRNQNGEPVLEKIIEDEKETGKYSYTYKNDEDKIKVLNKIVELSNINEEFEFRKISLSELERCEQDEYDSLSGADIEAMLFMIENE